MVVIGVFEKDFSEWLSLKLSKIMKNVSFMKRIAMLLCSLITSTTLFAQAVGDEFVVDNVKYTVTSVAPNEAEVSGFSDLDAVPANLSIPAVATDAGNSATYNIVAVGNGAFSCNSAANKGAGDARNNALETVTLPASLLHLGDHSFRENPNLKSINLNTVSSSGTNVFVKCGALFDIGSLDKLTDMGSYMFYQCHSLLSIETPALVSIGDGNIYDMDGIVKYNVPSSVTTVGKLFLGLNDALTAVQVNWADPEAIAMSSDNFFRGEDFAAGRVTIYVPEGKEAAYRAHALWGQFPDENIVVGILPSIGETFTIDNIEYMVTNESPNEVKVVGFVNLDAATATVSIPSSVTYAENAKSYDVVSIGVGAFSCDAAKGGGDDKNLVIAEVVLPSSLTTVDNFAFYGCRNLESINLDAVSSIGTNAFGICDKMHTIGELSALKDLGNYAFFRCSGLTAIETPVLETIGTGNIYAMSGLTSYNIPATVIEIGSLFMGTDDVTDRPCNITAVQVNWSDPSAVTIDATNFFRNVDLTAGGVTLYVPTGTETLYEAHSLWGQIPDEKIIEGDIRTGLIPTQEVDLSFYPNPTETGCITINGETGQVVSLEVFNLSGTQVFKQDVRAGELIATGLDSGVYMLKVNGRTIQKLVVN